MTPFRKIIISLFMLIFAGSAATFADTFNLSTYHSSAKGNYSLLKLPPKNTLSGNCTIGGFYTKTNGELQYCDDDTSGNGTGIWGPVPGIWRHKGNNIFLTDYTNSSLKVGIGTSNPQSLLHINQSLPVNYGSPETDGDLLITYTDPGLVLIGENSSVSESHLFFPEVNTSGNYTNLWTFGRTTAIGGSRLFLSHMISSGDWWDMPANQRLNWTHGKFGIGPFGGWPTPKMPQTQLHLLDDDGATNLRLEEATGAVNTHSIWELQVVDQESGPAETQNAFKIYGGTASSLATRLMIQKNGHIGIAKTSPVTAALDIAGSGTLKLESSAPFIEMHDTDLTSHVRFSLDTNRSKIQMKRIPTDPWRDHLTFNLTNRYVALGNNITPAYPLHIAGSTADQTLAIEHTEPYFELADSGNLNWQLTTGFEIPGENRLALRNNHGGPFANIITIHNDAGVTRVGLGVGSPDNTKALQLYTGAYIRSDTGDVCSGSGNCLDAHFVSDLRLKKDIQPLTGALDKINALRVVTFDWNDPEKYGKDHQLGFIAQEVEKIFPQWVITKKDGYKALDIYGFEGLVVEGLRELDAKITEAFSSLNTHADHLQIKMNENIQTFEKEKLLFEKLFSKLK